MAPNLREITDPEVKWGPCKMKDIQVVATCEKGELKWNVSYHKEKFRLKEKETRTIFMSKCSLCVFYIECIKFWQGGGLKCSKVKPVLVFFWKIVYWSKMSSQKHFNKQPTYQPKLEGLR